MIKRSDLQPNPNGLAVALYLYDINNSLPKGTDLDKEEQTIELLNSGANSAKMSFEPVLPENPLADTINPNLNTNLSQVLAVYNGNTGALDADYTYGLDRIAVHDEDTSTGKVQDPLYYLYDGMGRVTELTKPTAQVSDKYRFDAFGVELPGGKMSPNAYKVLNNPFGYNGEQYDPEAGLSYMRNRYYEPDTGRFINRDLLPGYLSEPLSMNPYAYVTNNPLQFEDPLGLSKSKRRYWVNGHEIDEESALIFKAVMYSQSVKTPETSNAFKIIENNYPYRQNTYSIPQLDKEEFMIRTEADRLFQKDKRTQKILTKFGVGAGEDWLLKLVSLYALEKAPKKLIPIYNVISTANDIVDYTELTYELAPIYLECYNEAKFRYKEN